jgi:hypothetical protein
VSNFAESNDGKVLCRVEDTTVPALKFLLRHLYTDSAMLTGARPFSGPSLPFCLPVIATRSIVLSIGAESSG